MRSPEMTAEEIVRRGVEIYDTRLKPTLEPAENGRYVCINIENGDFALADTTTEAGAEMRALYPDQVFFEARVGYPVVTYWMTPGSEYVARAS